MTSCPSLKPPSYSDKGHQDAEVNQCFCLASWIIQIVLGACTIWLGRCSGTLDLLEQVFYWAWVTSWNSAGCWSPCPLQNIVEMGSAPYRTSQSCHWATSTAHNYTNRILPIYLVSLFFEWCLQLSVVEANTPLIRCLQWIAYSWFDQLNVALSEHGLWNAFCCQMFPASLWWVFYSDVPKFNGYLLASMASNTYHLLLPASMIEIIGSGELGRS